MYLFARLFFGDLPYDMFLFYLELYKITKTAPDPKQQIIQTPQLMVEVLPLLVHSAFPNFEPKRQYALLQSMYQMWFHTRENDETISFISVAQIMMYSLLCFRRTSGQMLRTLFSKTATNESIAVRQFREMCSLVLPQLK